MKKILPITLFLFLLFIGIYLLFPETLFHLLVNVGRYSAGLTRKEIQVDDHRIVYLEGGKGQTIVLLHGFAANKDNWIQFSRYLTKDYHVVIPDLPGFGESSQRQSENYAAGNQLKRIDRFTETLKLEKFHLAGNSMGGMLAAMYGATYPRKVITLALLAPGGVGSPNPSEVALLIQKGTNPLLTGNPEDFDRLINLCFVKPPFIPARFKRVLAADAVAHRDFNKKIWDDMLGSLSREALSARETLLRPYLPQIQAPVLVVWGDGDKVLDVGGATILEKNLRDFQTVIMKDMGHAPMLERPQETASYYTGFLKGKR